MSQDIPARPRWHSQLGPGSQPSFLTPVRLGSWWHKRGVQSQVPVAMLHTETSTGVPVNSSRRSVQLSDLIPCEGGRKNADGCGVHERW